MPQFTIQQAFDLALRHHHAGRLHEAEQLYRQILDRQPDHAGALHYLGVSAHQQRQNETAISLIRRAIALGPHQPEPHNNLGLALKETGQVDAAIASYRQAIALRPNYPGALYNLGIALQSEGQLDDAIAAYRQAIVLQANYVEALVNLGSALSEKGQKEEAIAILRKAIALGPRYAQAYCNLGNVLKDAGQRDEAIRVFGEAIALEPNLPEAHNNLGNVLRDNAQMDQAIPAYRRAIAIKPDFAVAYYNLANALRINGLADEAITTYRQAIALRPDYAAAHNNLGDVLRSKGKFDEAIAMSQRAIALKPTDANAHFNMGNALRDNGQFDEAIVAYRQAIALRPDHADAHNNLGHVFKDRGQLDDAIAAYRKAVANAPGDPEVQSNLVYALYFHPAYTVRSIAEETHRWNQQHAESLSKFIEVHTNDRSPNRRLRVGYVSPDFRDHVVGRNLLQLLLHHDRSQFDITCYAHVLKPDAMTEQLHRQTDRWRDIVGLSDAQGVQQICEDQIDILIDLTLHMANNRLLIFAQKPAPVQVTYLAYAGSSGMSAMDYRLSDPHLDPPGTDLSVYTEKTIRLPRTYWCYQPGPAPAPATAPVRQNAFVTFGCLNNFAKVSSRALDEWAKILAAVPNSRMILHALPGEHAQGIARRLEQAGVASRRMQFIGRQPWSAYVQTYSKIDIALDPFPYAGGITTLDGLWMGVPVVTLSGDTAVGRGGRSILSNLGLPELIAYDHEQYVQIAISLARDLDRINALRRDMRARMLASPLMDAAQFAHDVETAYRSMWHNWCKAADG